MLKRASPQTLRRTSRINVLTRMHLCNTNRPRTANSEQRTAQARENAIKKKHFHHLGQGGYKAAILKWQKMEEDLIARGIVPATFNWLMRAKYFFYAHGGTLNMEDGSFVTSDAIREAANKLDDALKAMSEGS